MLRTGHRGGTAKLLSRHRRIAAGLGLAACAGVVLWRLDASGDDAVTPAYAASSPAPPAALLDADAILDEDILFYEARAAADPYSAGDHARLALLLLERGRTRGDPDDAIRAEHAARRSLTARTAHNDGAAELLAASLLEQHRFADARDVARYLVARDTESIAHRALLAETELELGEYQVADSIFRSLQPRWRELSVAPRVARWQEIHGRLEDARLTLRILNRDALADSYLPRSQIAWSHYRLGDFEMRYGHAEAARAALEAGLRLAPDDSRLLAAMARLEAGDGNWPAAIALADRSIAAVADPDVLGLLSDAHAALGDTAQAKGYARAVASLSLGNPDAMHRSWSLFWLDRGEHVKEVLARAGKEVAVRPDVYGDDVLAWALHTAGRSAEAKVAIERALSQGTRDPSMLFHAGMISRALGDDEDARRHLEAALSINPRFHPMHARTASSVVDSLKRAMVAP